MTNTFAQYVATRLVELDITADRLAEILGHKRSTTIGMWVRGDFIPDQLLLPRIAKGLEADLVTLSLKWLGAALPEHADDFEDATYRRPALIAITKGPK